jgi:hypothetical protein
MTTNRDNEKIEQTSEQSNPYLARPEDFEIGAPAQTSPTPGHGQRGLTKSEERLLLAKRKSQGKGVDLGTTVDDATPYDLSR